MEMSSTCCDCLVCWSKFLWDWTGMEVDCWQRQIKPLYKSRLSVALNQSTREKHRKLCGSIALVGFVWIILDGTRCRL